MTKKGLRRQGGVSVAQCGGLKMFSLVILIFDLPKDSKITNIFWFAQSKLPSKKQPAASPSQSQQNNKSVFDLFKVSKTTTKFLTCSNSAK